MEGIGAGWEIWKISERDEKKSLRKAWSNLNLGRACFMCTSRLCGVGVTLSTKVPRVYILMWWCTYRKRKRVIRFKGWPLVGMHKYRGRSIIRRVCWVSG